MSEIDSKINRKKKELEYRLIQYSQCDKRIRSYYSDQIHILKEEILDLESLKIFNMNINDNNIIDIHGATRYFIDYYLEDLLYLKSENNKSVKLITGKGTLTLFHLVKKFLKKYNFTFKIEDYSFQIQF
jgi:hypothetical protein